MGNSKILFLDRDGVINNNKNGHLYEPNQIQLLPGASEALALAHQSGFKNVLITNQGIVARGMCTVDELENIHLYLQTLLKQEVGNEAHLDYIFYCPHLPYVDNTSVNQKYDKTFIPNTEFIKACTCRKPNPGLVFKALETMGRNPKNIKNCYFIGDTWEDYLTARNARIEVIEEEQRFENHSGFIGVETGFGCRMPQHLALQTHPFRLAPTILQAVQMIIMQEEGLPLTQTLSK